MSILISLFEPALHGRAGPGPAPPPARHGAVARGLALALAMTLALFLVAAAGHRHDSQAEPHACAICTLLMDELPCTDALPPVVAAVAAHAYVLLRVIAYVCWYRRPPLTPPSCGPPCVPLRPEVAIVRFHLPTIPRFTCNALHNYVHSRC